MMHPSVPQRPPLRVALLNPSLWVGGSTVFTLNLGTELLRRGIPAEAFAPGVVHSLEADFIRCGLPVSRLRHEGLVFEDRTAIMLEELRRFAPTAVIASVGFDTCELLRYLPPGVARIGIIHATNPGVFQSADTYAPWLDHLVGVSGGFEKSLKNSVRKFSAGQISSIELGVPVPESPVELDPSSTRPLRILYLGRLEDDAKRVRLFPQIFRDLCAASLPFRWTIAGIGPEQGFLESQMVSPSPQQEVRFAGLVPYSELPGLFREHDIILLTSDTETFSLSLHEGMAAGLVPVASALSGRVGEIVTAKTGCPVPPDQISGYARAILWLHEHRAEMAAMSRASRQTISAHYSVAAMTDRWVAFLTPLVPSGTLVWPEHCPIKVPVGWEKAWRYKSICRPLRKWGGRARAVLHAMRDGFISKP